MSPSKYVEWIKLANEFNLVGSSLPKLYSGGAKNLWVKKKPHTRGERLNITTYNVRTLLKEEHVQELEEELK